MGEDKELLGVKIPGVPLFKRKKKVMLSGKANYYASMKTDGSNIKKDKYRSPLEQWRLSLEKKRDNLRLQGLGLTK